MHPPRVQLSYWQERGLDVTELLDTPFLVDEEGIHHSAAAPCNDRAEVKRHPQPSSDICPRCWRSGLPGAAIELVNDITLLRSIRPTLARGDLVGTIMALKNLTDVKGAAKEVQQQKERIHDRWKSEHPQTAGDAVAFLPRTRIEHGLLDLQPKVRKEFEPYWQIEHETQFVLQGPYHKLRKLVRTLERGSMWHTRGSAEKLRESDTSETIELAIRLYDPTSDHLPSTGAALRAARILER